MLLDQKRTKRTVQVVAILTSIAFAGVIFVVLGLILFGGGGQSAADEELAAAQELAEERPRDPDAWDRLAAAYRSTEDLDQALTAARRAAELAPRDLDRALTVVLLQNERGDAEGALQTLQGYTAANPRNAEGFLQLAQQAESAGRTQLARLSYEAFLRLAPDDRNAEAVRERIATLQAGGAGTTG